MQKELVEVVCIEPGHVLVHFGPEEDTRKYLYSVEDFDEVFDVFPLHFRRLGQRYVGTFPTLKPQPEGGHAFWVISEPIPEMTKGVSQARHPRHKRQP